MLGTLGRVAFSCALALQAVQAAHASARGGLFFDLTVSPLNAAFLVGEPVPIELRTCNPTGEAIIFITPTTCSVPELEILNSAGEVVAFEKCDGPDMDKKFVFADFECKSQTIVWPQTEGRFWNLGVILGSQVASGLYRARWNSPFGEPELSEEFAIQPEVPALGVVGLGALSLLFAAFAAWHLRR